MLYSGEAKRLPTFWFNKPLANMFGWHEEFFFPVMKMITSGMDTGKYRLEATEMVMDVLRGFHFLITYCQQLIKEEPIGNTADAVLGLATPDYSLAINRIEPLTVTYKRIKENLALLQLLHIKVYDSLGRRIEFQQGMLVPSQVTLHFRQQS